jgi:hypothetical protein
MSTRGEAVLPAPIVELRRRTNRVSGPGSGAITARSALRKVRDVR